MALNKVLLLGNLGNAPEVRYLEKSGKVASFRVATTERYKNSNGEAVEQTEWHSVTVWNKTADFAEKYLSKGTQVFLEGRLRTRSYQDKDGREVRVTEIVADNIQLCGKRSDGETPRATAPAPQQSASKGALSQGLNTATPADDDDLPF